MPWEQSVLTVRAMLLGESFRDQFLRHDMSLCNVPSRVAEDKFLVALFQVSSTVAQIVIVSVRLSFLQSFIVVDLQVQVLNLSGRNFHT